jgi:hypothetical protein
MGFERVFRGGVFRYQESCTRHSKKLIIQ